MFGILPGDLLDREFGRCNDRAYAFGVTPRRRPAKSQLTSVLTHFEVDAGVPLQTEARSLQNRRDRRADEVVGVNRELGVTAGKN